MDSVTREVRSRIMAGIKQRDSQIERRFRSRLWQAGIRYRKNVRMYGTPDIAIRSKKLVVFVDSCFWHGCRFHCRRPKTNRAFWSAKINRNRCRDLKITRFYRRRGWLVFRFWEHQLVRDIDDCVSRVVDGLNGVPRGR